MYAPLTLKKVITNPEEIWTNKQILNKIYVCRKQDLCIINCIQLREIPKFRSRISCGISPEI